MVPISTMWVLKAKLTALGILDKLKARLVARAFSQREGRDYWSTFAPVMKLDTFDVIWKDAAPLPQTVSISSI